MYDPAFTQSDIEHPNPNYPQPPFQSENQPSTPGTLLQASAPPPAQF